MQSNIFNHKKNKKMFTKTNNKNVCEYIFNKYLHLVEFEELIKEGSTLKAYDDMDFWKIEKTKNTFHYCCEWNSIFAVFLIKKWFVYSSNDKNVTVVTKLTDFDPLFIF